MSEDRDQPFDAADFIAKLQRGVAEQAAVAARRPSGEQLAGSLHEASKHLCAWTEQWRMKACLLKGKDPTQTYEWLPLDDSEAGADKDAAAPLIAAYCASDQLSSHHWLDTNPTRNPASWAIDYLARCFHTVVDNLEGIATLIEGSERLRAPITLSRSVLEAAAMGCFVTSKAVDGRERLRRSLNLHFAQTKESSNERVGADDQGDYETELIELIGFAESAGFEVARYRRDGVQPPVIRPPTGSNDSARSIIDAVLPGIGTSMWRSMSAVAHARSSQVLIPDEYALPHEVKPWQRVESVAWHTLPSILVVRELCLHVETYLGWDFEPWSDHWEQVAGQWAVAAGLDDARIRRELGFVPRG